MNPIKAFIDLFKRDRNKSKGETWIHTPDLPAKKEFRNVDILTPKQRKARNRATFASATRARQRLQARVKRNIRQRNRIQNGVYTRQAGAVDYLLNHL